MGVIKVAIYFLTSKKVLKVATSNNSVRQILVPAFKFEQMYDPISAHNIPVSLTRKLY